MNLTKPDQNTEHTMSSSYLRPWSAPSGEYTGDAIPDEARRIVEHAWSVKTMIRWTRDDRGPFSALRWCIWDRFNTGHPPSRTEGKGGALVMVNEDGSVTERRSQKDYLRPVSMVSRW